MNTVRLNITLPSEIGEALKGISNKSAFIAQAIHERLERERQKQLIETLREGYSVTFEEDKVLSQDWNCTIGDGLA